MLETAAWADQEGAASEVGKGEIRRWRALYANAEVDDAVDSLRDCCKKKVVLRAGNAAVRRDRERMAFREAMIEAWEFLPIQLNCICPVLCPYECLALAC